MTDRSVLRLGRPHIHPDRREEIIVEVLRGGKTVASIYGSREGLNIVSHLATRNKVFLLEGAGPVPSWVIPLLAEGEVCPWCDGLRLVRVPTGEVVLCPVCAAPDPEFPSRQSLEAEAARRGMTPGQVLDELMSRK